MSRRYFRAPDGRWFAGFHAGTFSDDGVADAAAIAVACSIAGPLTVVTVGDGDPDPRTGATFAEPARTPSAPDPDLVALRDALADAQVPAYVKALIRRSGVR